MGTKQTNGHSKNGKAQAKRPERPSKKSLESERPSKRQMDGGEGKNGKDNAKLQALIEQGKAKGFLTYDEVNDAVPADPVVADQMDDALGMLGDEDIEIVD